MTVALNWETGVIGDDEAKGMLDWLESNLNGLLT